jgi:hypothetical protein
MKKKKEKISLDCPFKQKRHHVSILRNLGVPWDHDILYCFMSVVM